MYIQPYLTHKTALPLMSSEKVTEPEGIRLLWETDNSLEQAGIKILICRKKTAGRRLSTVSTTDTRFDMVTYGNPTCSKICPYQNTLVARHHVGSVYR